MPVAARGAASGVSDSRARRRRQPNASTWAGNVGVAGDNAARDERESSCGSAYHMTAHPVRAAARRPRTTRSRRRVCDIRALGEAAELVASGNSCVLDDLRKYRRLVLDVQADYPKSFVGGSTTPRAGGRVSVVARCAERTFRRPAAVSTVQSTRSRGRRSYRLRLATLPLARRRSGPAQIAVILSARGREESSALGVRRSGRRLSVRRGFAESEADRRIRSPCVRCRALSWWPSG